jgi:eukaryotic-like serine/threonine-protein kinase
MVFAMNTRADVPHYVAFISYSHDDKPWADWLHKALETYRVPKRLVGQSTAAGVIPPRLIPIFRDSAELASSSDLNRSVNAALAESRNLIVICSPSAAQSRWVNTEVSAFKRNGRSDGVFCLIVAGEPNATDIPGHAAEECFVPALRYAVDADGHLTSERTEPIAADIRPGRDSKANARLKLVAGLLGIGFDALKQRELQRHYHRLAAATALALVVMLITTTLAITALISRNDAERRQKQAENLVGFMIGDLTAKLRKRESLDVLQTVDDKTMAYFSSLSSRDVTDSSLAMRVDALQKIGSVREDRGDIPAALESYVAASTLASELMRRSPGDVRRQADYSNSLTWIGKAYWYQGDLDHAAQKFEAASDILRKAVATNPKDTDLAFKLGVAMTNAGRVLEAHGEFAAAKTNYDAVQKIFEDLLEREPSNTEWQLQLGNAYDSLGKLALELGHLDVAIQDYRANERIQAALAAREPNNHDQEYELVISEAILGRTLGSCGELEAATRYLGDAITGLQSLMNFDSTQTEYQYLFARYSEQLGGVLRQRGQLEAAGENDARSITVLEKLTAKDPTNIEWQQELARSRIETARQHLARGDAESAAKVAARALDSIEGLRAKNTADRNLLLLAAQADVVAGQASAGRSDELAARHNWERARDTLATAVETGSDPNFLAAWASAQLLLNEVEAARPVVARLSMVGYRTPDFVELVARRKLAYGADPVFAQRIAEVLR